MNQFCVVYDSDQLPLYWTYRCFLLARQKRQVIDIAMFILTIIFTLEMMMKVSLANTEHKKK